MTIKRIVIHHTAGGYTPNAVDLSHYQHLIAYNPDTQTGKIVEGTGNKGKFEHVGGLNSTSIGVSICCNYEYDSSTHYTKYPLTKIQFEKLCAFVASLCIKYNLEITTDTVLTHYEISKDVQSGKLPKNKLTEANIGKIDITYLPFAPKIKPDDVGNYFRDHIAWYKNKLK